MENIMNRNLPQVGAPDPELNTSPIFDECDEEAPAEFDVETGVCYFNAGAYGYAKARCGLTTPDGCPSEVDLSKRSRDPRESGNRALR
jgi:hypothetical protein